jgi:hypothetical protein
LVNSAFGSIITFNNCITTVSCGMIAAFTSFYTVTRFIHAAVGSNIAVAGSIIGVLSSNNAVATNMVVASNSK